MFKRFTRRLYFGAYRVHDDNPYGDRRIGFTRQNDHTYNVLHLYFLNIVFGIKPSKWFEDIPEHKAN